MDKRPVLLKKDFETPAHEAWGTVNHDDFTKITDHNELIVSGRVVEKLDDLTIDEEIACWKLAFERGARMIASDVQSAAILINDGLAANQSIPHAHIHLVGDKRFESGVSLERELHAIRDKYCVPIPVSPKFIEGIRVHFNSIRSFVEQRRAITARHPEANGFSLYSQNPSLDLMDWQDHDLVIEGWGDNSLSPYSLTNMLRVWSGLREKPDRYGKITYSHYEVA